MTWLKEVPKVIASNTYWEHSPAKQDEILISVLCDGFNLQDKNFTRKNIANKVSYIRTKSDMAKIKSATKLLADASKGYINNGPLGPRPILISAYALCKVCGARTEGQTRKYRNIIDSALGGLESVISEYTASNPDEHTYCPFSAQDLARGIVLPRKPEDVPELMGLLAADTVQFSEIALYIYSKLDQTEFYKNGAKKIIENALNYPFVYNTYADGGEKKIGAVSVSFTDTHYPRIKIQSKAFMRWLHHKFINSSNGLTLKRDIINYFISDCVSPYYTKRFAYAYLATQGAFTKTPSHRQPYMVLNNQQNLATLLDKAKIPPTPKSRCVAALKIGVNTVKNVIANLIIVNPDLEAKYLAMLE